MNPRTPASRWRRLLKLKRKKINSFKIITGFFFTPPLFLATKVAISFVYCSPKTIKCTQKPKIEKSLQESTNRASERAIAILHIISTTHFCACAQFTSSKRSYHNARNRSASMTWAWLQKRSLIVFVKHNVIPMLVYEETCGYFSLLMRLSRL